MSDWLRDDRQRDHEQGHPSLIDCDGDALSPGEACGHRYPTPEPSEVAETTAGEREVEALAEVFRHVGSPTRVTLARAVLASPWLAAHVSAAETKARADALREAADALNQDSVDFREWWSPNRPGCGPEDGAALDTLKQCLAWLRDRAASIARGDAR